MLRMLLRRATGGVVIAAGAIFVAYSLPEGDLGRAQRVDGLRSISLARGDIVQSVTAAGTLEAVDTVEVSSQLSGQIAKLMADYNSSVRAETSITSMVANVMDRIRFCTVV